MLRATQALDSLYNTFSESDSVTSKKKMKTAFIQRIVNSLDTISFSDGKKRSNRFARKLPNNTYFMSFKTYESKHDSMKEEWTGMFHNDLRQMINHYKKEYPFL